jgi:hypothetical protein
MELKNNSIAGKVVLDISGYVTGMADVAEINSAIASDSAAGEINFIFHDAVVIPSALIGTLLKLVQKDGKKVVIEAKQNGLKDLLGRLKLTTLIDVR